MSVLPGWKGCASLAFLRHWILLVKSKYICGGLHKNGPYRLILEHLVPSWWPVQECVMCPGRRRCVTWGELEVLKVRAKG